MVVLGSKPVEEKFYSDFHIPVEKIMAAVNLSGANNKEDSGDNDKLPVVELRPFIPKTWAPSKSRAVSDKARAHTSLGISSRRSVEGGLESRSKTQFTPRENSVPCPRAFSVTGDRVSRHPRPKEGTKLGFPRRPKVAFVSKQDRHKTTIDDIQSGSTVNTQFSCLKRALTDLDVQQQQHMKVRGKKFDKLPNKQHNLYYEPWQRYKGDNTNNTQSVVDTMYMRLESIENAFLDDSIYDTFDRTSSLPSINVRKAHMKRKENIDPARQPSAKSLQGGYRLGVTNTLDIMSHYGKPLDVEQHLSTELRQTIKNLRRTKDNTNVVTPAIFRGFSSKYEGVYSTPGEMSIQQNAFRLRQNAKSQKSARSKQSSIDSVSSDPVLDAGTSSTKAQDGLKPGNTSLKSSSFRNSASLEKVISTVHETNEKEINRLSQQSNSTLKSSKVQFEANSVASPRNSPVMESDDTKDEQRDETKFIRLCSEDSEIKDGQGNGAKFCSVPTEDDSISIDNTPRDTDVNVPLGPPGSARESVVDEPAQDNSKVFLTNAKDMPVEG